MRNWDNIDQEAKSAGAAEKRCTKCKDWKSPSGFYRMSTGKNGLQSQCKECIKKSNKKYRQTHKTKVIKSHQLYQQNHKIELAKYLRKYRKTTVGYLRCCFYNLKQRCDNPKNPIYKYYGGRGIKCLFKSADEFVDYVINELKIKSQNLDIDRIDNNGHYEKGNIRFVTHKENCNNRRERTA